MTARAKVIILFVALIGLLFVSPVGVYALGGGGSGGDGRTDLAQGAGATDESGTQGTAGEVTLMRSSGFSTMTAVVVPEPGMLLLVGVGFVGVAGMRRRIGK